MDKSYYCRVLGVREDASVQQIKQAYEERVKRLKSGDYADDSEYVSRKLGEAAYAYRVLLGGEVPSAKEGRKRSNASKNAAATKSAAGETLKKKAGKTVESVTGSKEAKSVAGIVFSIIIAVASLAIGSCDSSPTPEYNYDDTAYMEANSQAVERVLERSMEYDFYGNLDGSSTVSDGEINWEIENDEEVVGELWGFNQDLSYALGIEGLSYGIDFYSGVEDYYYRISDYEVSLMLAEMMGAPAFEDIAGMVNEYRGEAILDYRDYMVFLIDTAENQTDEICGPPVEYYY